MTVLIIFLIARVVFSAFIAKRFYAIGYRKASVFMFLLAFFTSPLLMWITLGDLLS